MTENEKSLAECREELIVKIAAQREQFISQIAETWPRREVSAGRYLLSCAGGRPFLSIAIALGSLFFFRSRKLLSIFAFATVAFKTWAQLSPVMMPYLKKAKQLCFSRKPKTE